MSDEPVRLNKYIAQCGICSRREADRLIEQGCVSVNGKIAGMGVKVTAGDNVTVNGKQLEGKDEKVVLAYYKPVGVTCTEKDRHAEKTVTEGLNYPVRVTYAGRLDKDSEGLLLMTNDGDLINKLMRGRNGHEKEYLVSVTKEIGPDFKEKMESGVFLRELNQKTRPCKVYIEDPHTFRIILTQGLNRQIRRMCESLGYRVDGLMRTRIANIEIGKLMPGTYRRLTSDELNGLYEAVSR